MLQQMEQVIGHDFSGVRVHADSAKPSALGALAYTQGHDVYVAPGRYRPETPEGRQLLGHELTHVAQQAAGRVHPTTRAMGVAINNDPALEREADERGVRSSLAAVPFAPRAADAADARASSAQMSSAGGASSQMVSHPTSGPVVQAKMGFELELLALVDIDGRPPPEKRFLGSYGAERLELQVDQNGDVEGETPRAPVDADFRAAGRLPTGANPDPEWADFGPYDLPAGMGYESRTAAPGVVVDPRAALPFTLLDNDVWRQRTATDRFTRPPAVNNTGLDNADLPAIDNAIVDYDTEMQNWEAARARGRVNIVIGRATAWLAANNAPPAHGLVDIVGRRRRSRYLAARATMQALLNEAQQHRAFWMNPVNHDPPAALERQYRRPTPGNPNPAWSTRHPVAGAGGDHYASILEIVTRPYDPETLAGRAGLLAAMTEAHNLAAAIEVATGNFATRAQLNTIAGTTILNPQTFVGNDDPTRNPQTTDASIQSTFAIDLTQIGSLMKSTVAFGAPQQRLTLKHQADEGASAQNPGGTNRAELEMVLAVRDATAVIGDLKAHMGGGPPSFVNLRGLLILVCQYLRLGRYWTGPEINALDKNLTDLLSRTNLAHIYAELVPAAEKAWLGAAGGNVAWLEGRIIARTGRAGASALLNRPTQDRNPEGGHQFSITCTQFVHNVLTSGDDGVTGHWGGFQQRPAEDIDPLAAHRAADPRPVAAAHRMAPVFEMRNMIPKLGGAERFPRAEWVPLSTYLAEMVELLNARTEAQAVQDVRAAEPHAAPPAGHVVGLNPPEPAW